MKIWIKNTFKKWQQLVINTTFTKSCQIKIEQKMNRKQGVVKQLFTTLFTKMLVNVRVIITFISCFFLNMHFLNYNLRSLLQLCSIHFQCKACSVTSKMLFNYFTMQWKNFQCSLTVNKNDYNVTLSHYLHFTINIKSCMKCSTKEHINIYFRITDRKRVPPGHASIIEMSSQCMVYKIFLRV